MAVSRTVALSAGTVAPEPVDAAFLATQGTEELALPVPGLCLLELLQLTHAARSLSAHCLGSGPSLADVTAWCFAVAQRADVSFPVGREQIVGDASDFRPEA